MQVISSFDLYKDQYTYLEKSPKLGFTIKDACDDKDLLFPLLYIL